MTDDLPVFLAAPLMTRTSAGRPRDMEIVWVVLDFQVPGSNSADVRANGIL